MISDLSDMRKLKPKLGLVRAEDQPDLQTLQNSPVSGCWSQESGVKGEVGGEAKTRTG